MGAAAFESGSGASWLWPLVERTAARLWQKAGRSALESRTRPMVSRLRRRMRSRAIMSMPITPMSRRCLTAVSASSTRYKCEAP